MFDKSWDHVWNRLFDRRTCLFYDYITDNSDLGIPDDAVSHLPSPELIQRQIPNPGGFGTGMEDCALSAGTMMDTVVARYKATGDTGMKEYASAVYKGMELLTDVCETPGFVARGVSPVDKKSHYYNSSRDQFTHWVWGAWLFFFSGLADDREKESVRERMERIAGMCEKRCVEENGYDLLRDDGGAAIVSKMWGDVDSHEIGRLPMFYLAAWSITGDSHWRDLYLRMRDTVYRMTLPYDMNGHPVYAGLQLQYSLRLMHDAEDDPEWKERYRAVMARIADGYEKTVMSQTESLMKPERSAKLSLKMLRWDKAMAAYRGFIGGYAYYCPWQQEAVNNAFYPLLNVGESASIAALCPGYEVNPETAECIYEIEDRLDTAHHSTYAPMAILNAGWRIKLAEKELT